MRNHPLILAFMGALNLGLAALSWSHGRSMVLASFFALIGLALLILPLMRKRESQQ